VEQLIRGALGEQLTLDGGNATAQWLDAERAADAARSRFGSAAVQPATLLNPPGWFDRGESELSPESGNESG
jgi:DNA polymerase-4